LDFSNLGNTLTLNKRAICTNRPLCSDRHPRAYIYTLTGLGTGKHDFGGDSKTNEALCEVKNADGGGIVQVKTLLDRNQTIYLISGSVRICTGGVKIGISVCFTRDMKVTGRTPRSLEQSLLKPILAGSL
jgi:hypothetical protein